MAESRNDIRISLDSGANCRSQHDVETDVFELGFESREEWDAATDEQKLQAVQDYFYAQGHPTWSWDD